MKCALFAAAVLGVLVPLPSRAHITLVYPPPRPGTVSPIGSPCGYSPDPGRTTAQPLLPGATIEVRWNEWIGHPSHFRISFDDDGQDDFLDPASPTDFYTAPSVLLDEITDNGTSDHSATITLPMIECGNCTLQVMQVLQDKLPYTSGPDSDDLHRVCADLTLTLDAEFIFDSGFEDPPAAQVLELGGTAR